MRDRVRKDGEFGNCVFCGIVENSEVLLENRNSMAFYDRSPVNEGHMLIIPKNHKENYFNLSQIELLDIHSLLHECKKYLEKKYNTQHFNIGWNCGEASGQTVFHAHCHLIPRYAGDVENPRGGIRNFKPPLVRY